MFENEITLNQFLLEQLGTIMADLPEDCLFTPGTGHGHPPVWILGHLAIVGEMGQTFLGAMLRILPGCRPLALVRMTKSCRTPT
ncbi:hypothetical protein [Gimesia fumaroli]|uniref:DinB superfamily protein n=1 Tax=Gimesia fumaroli TaxID=2527976 RepID=A0A518I4L1_9PLAN|nr:hypothetical protein [Gimesia fumaroli]QDV48040.1 hypothetical protein Enr17x_00490 [Gimesia fumaroli]